MAGKNCQSCRHTHSHTHTHVHIYPPCHDAHQETPSRLLAPRAPPVRVDILRKHTQYQKCARTGAETDLCRCTWLMLCFFFFLETGMFFSPLLWDSVLRFVTSSHLASPNPGRCRHNTLVGWEETDGAGLPQIFSSWDLSPVKKKLQNVHFLAKQTHLIWLKT